MIDRLLDPEVARTATCACGQLSVTCTGEPVRISICHCLACQRRSGSSFAAQARFPAERVTVAGESRAWQRVADSGHTADHHFCPVCGSTVYYHSRPHHDLVAVPIGAFADPRFSAPRHSAYERRKHAWVAIVSKDIEHAL